MSAMPAARRSKTLEWSASGIAKSLQGNGKTLLEWNNLRVEKRIVVLWVKHMINGSAGGLAVLLLACAVLMPPAQAEAVNAREIREGVRKGNAQNPPQLRDQRAAKRPYFQRRETGEEQRPPRLSPEERRQLRRDIKDAGRQIYPQRR